MAKEKLMFDDKELNLIKAVFAENEELLIAIRKLFFGVDITPAEKDAIKQAFANPEVIRVVRHRTYGLNEFDTPIGQLSEFWMGAEKQIFGASRDTIEQAIKSKAMVLEMFETAFKLLENPDGVKVTTKFTVDQDDFLGTNLIARNLYMQAIETSLANLKMIAGQKNETLEQTLKRIQQDSAK